MNKYRKLILWLGLISLFMGCSKKETELIWDKRLYLIGSQSSPRATDLNDDKILDIVIGAGKNEYQHSDKGIIAVNGETGELLWQQEAEDQVFGSPTFNDITGDGIDDVFIGGRSRCLKALDGATGELLWEYTYKYEDDPVLKYARYNFYSSVLVPDQNGDGIKDLLISNGGNSKIGPYVEEGRFPGVLMVFDSKTGNILAADTMPDGAETYMSPVSFSQPGDEAHYIIFGSGGETLGGHLYRAKLSDLMDQDLANARVLATGVDHGFIAPPVLADINLDGYLDITAISHASIIFAVDGRTNGIIWQQHVEGTECSNSFAVGYFTPDDIPDFFTFVSEGQWPNNTGSLQIMINGENGKIMYRNSLGCTGFSSPVVYDLNDDGQDEVLLSINEYDCEQGYTASSRLDIINKLVFINFRNQTVNVIDQTPDFKNIFTTPWIGDIDQDQYLDIVYCQYYSPTANLLAFMGMRMKRISTHIRMNGSPVWGAYMSTEGDGIFPVQN